MNVKKEEGVTLVALVVTIVVIFILVGITAGMVIDKEGFLKSSKEARNLQQNWATKEEQKTGELIEKVGEKPIISNEKSYVGYYADMDDDGEVDGVIYADLAVGKTNSSEEYEIEVVTTGLKEYYICKSSYIGSFYEEAKPVIAPIKESSGKERFYIMALEDVQLAHPYSETSNTAYWYCNAYDSANGTGLMTDWETYTSASFGKGKENTKKMIARWKKTNTTEVPNATEVDYGEQNEKDLWGQIDEYVEKGWYVPSKEEWLAFGRELGITKENYTKYNLINRYWSSHQASATNANYSDFVNNNIIYNGTVNNNFYVRLGATF